MERTGFDVFRVLWEQVKHQKVERIPLKAENIELLLDWMLTETAKVYRAGQSRKMSEATAIERIKLEWGLE